MPAENFYSAIPTLPSLTLAKVARRMQALIDIFVKRCGFQSTIDICSMRGIRLDRRDNQAKCSRNNVSELAWGLFELCQFLCKYPLSAMPAI